MAQLKRNFSITAHPVFDFSRIKKLVGPLVLYLGVGVSLTIVIFIAWFVSLLIV